MHEDPKAFGSVNEYCYADLAETGANALENF